MTYAVTWGRDETVPGRQPCVEITTVAELDQVLGQINRDAEADNAPVSGTLAP